MRVGSLFSGIGGIDLGLQRTGHFEIAWQVEIDEYCRKVLAQHWPDVERFEDVREAGAHNLSPVDLLCGGFPCQDISSAGKRAGIEGERSGLWREFARIISEMRPRYVLIENVAALLHTTKQPDGTRREAAIATVLRDLAECRYDAEWRVFSAAEFGAPHLRRRVFIVAYRNSGQCEGRAQLQDGWQQIPREWNIWANPDRCSAVMADAAGARRQEQQQTTGIHSGFDAQGSTLANSDRTRLEIRNGRTKPRGSCSNFDGYARHQGQAEPCMGGVFDGFSARLDGIEQRWPSGPEEEQFAWEPARVIQGKLENRVARLKGLGNSALPQIAEAIGYAIRRFDQARTGE